MKHRLSTEILSQLKTRHKNYKTFP